MQHLIFEHIDRISFEGVDLIELEIFKKDVMDQAKHTSYRGFQTMRKGQLPL